MHRSPACGLLKVPACNVLRLGGEIQVVCGKRYVHNRKMILYFVGMIRRDGGIEVTRKFRGYAIQCIAYRHVDYWKYRHATFSGAPAHAGRCSNANGEAKAARWRDSSMWKAYVHNRTMILYFVGIIHRDGGIEVTRKFRGYAIQCIARRHVDYWRYRHATFSGAPKGTGTCRILPLGNNTAVMNGNRCQMTCVKV